MCMQMYVQGGEMTSQFRAQSGQNGCLGRDCYPRSTGHGVSTQRLGSLIPMDGFGETLIGDVFGIEFEFLNGDTLLSDLGIRLDP